MAQSDTDAHDEPTVDLADLIRLKVASNGTSWNLNMTTPLRAAGIEGGDVVDADLLWEEDGPMLVFGKVPNGVSTDDDGARTRTVTDRGSGLSVKPPRELLEADSEYGAGLGLDRDDYDNDDPLCFQPLVDDGLVALAPVGHESTLTESQDGQQHPLSEEAASAAVQATGVSMEALRDALAAIASSVDVDELATAPNYDPLDVDDYRVLVVPDRVWTSLQEQFDLADDVLEAARLAHTRMAETLVVEAGTSDYRRFSQEYNAFVCSRSEDNE